jgi:hypothetical protein
MGTAFISRAQRIGVQRVAGMYSTDRPEKAV